MCEKCRDAHHSNLMADSGAANEIQPRESHTVYELKRQREYHIEQIVKITQAIDALNKI